MKFQPSTPNPIFRIAAPACAPAEGLRQTSDLPDGLRVHIEQLTRHVNLNLALGGDFDQPASYPFAANTTGATVSGTNVERQS
jgi:hypothetical protein